MRILVTGGSGFIGSHIVEHFQGKAEIRVLDNLRSGHRENLNGFDVDFRLGDICDRKAVDDAIALVGLSELRHRKVHQVSDGERQKAMIAKALAQQTPIIFLDEPTAFLDDAALASPCP